ncbi:probable RIB3-3,4-dihydroxy-2-butanone 4-phosphate synthase [Serendipita indica DSM 11827]|uniref:3,4-dihydroxy-2-butanone 4-phosphate synthase n=1 Tax=Serendipita indica (strain DSM 11827) TaxID=1109443 RepID=G4TA68_SERID|nr:probable RIB3-3,4-dihydroxy-2-butanone 4-phosphate synthase [Serendipita indica DSM 11827]
MASAVLATSSVQITFEEMSHYSVKSTSTLNAEEESLFDPIEDALAAFKNGEFLVVMDDHNRENEGDLICAASMMTTEKMAWFIKQTSGYICISMPGERLDELELPLMVPNNEEKHKTAYTITVDYKYGQYQSQMLECTWADPMKIIGTSTGISAHDRALTARKLASPSSQPSDFNRPGHLCPLRAREGGVLVRRGHTEAGLDLCRLTGLPQAALLCEIVNDDDQGTMARRDDCRLFADTWGLKMISIAQLVAYRQLLENTNGVSRHAHSSL